MGFVKTPDEIARIEHALSHPRFVNGEMLSIDFLSDPDYVASILPPPLEPADTPTLTAMVGRWQSNCVGDFYGGAIYVAARHDGIEGGYVLAMYMDDDVPTIYGRDLFGEPKKLARSELHRSGDAVQRLARARRRADHGAAAATCPRTSARARARAATSTSRRARRRTASGSRRTRSSRAPPSSRSRAWPAGHRHASPCAAPCTTRSTRSRSSRSSARAYMECDLIGACEAVATMPADVFAALPPRSPRRLERARHRERCARRRST